MLLFDIACSRPTERAPSRCFCPATSPAGTPAAARYIEVVGYPGVPTEDALTAHFVHSKIERTGAFECSDPSWTQTSHNHRYAALSNLVDIPTDCPQR